MEFGACSRGEHPHCMRRAVSASASARRVPMFPGVKALGCNGTRLWRWGWGVGDWREQDCDLCSCSMKPKIDSRENAATRKRPSCLLLSRVLCVVLFAPIIYLGAWIWFGPWGLILKMLATATSPNGSMKAKVYRKGMGQSWRAHVRVEDDSGIVFERVAGGFSNVEEPEEYFSEVRFDGNYLLVGPHASRKTDVIDYYRIPIYMDKREIVVMGEGR